MKTKVVLEHPKHREICGCDTCFNAIVKARREACKSYTTYKLYLFYSEPERGPHPVEPGKCCYRALMVFDNGDPPRTCGDFLYNFHQHDPKNVLPSFRWGQHCLVCDNKWQAEEEMKACFPDTFAGWVG